MADALVTLTGTIVDHDSGTPLQGVTVYAHPSRAISPTSDGHDAVDVADAETDAAGVFSLPLIHSEGTRYTITYRVSGVAIRRGTVDCDVHAAGSTVDVSDLPPVEGIPPSEIDELRAWILERIPTLTVVDNVLYIDEEPS